MKRVYISSPYSGDVNENILYARACMRHSLLAGEAPIVVHLLYTQPQVLNDSVEEERKIGTAAGLALIEDSALVAVYYDRGISKGMMDEMGIASGWGIPLEFRSLRKANEIWSTYREESQERGLTAMWLDEQERVEAQK